MLLRSSAPLAVQILFKRGLPCARYSNKIKQTLSNLFKSEPKVIVKDAVQAQSAIVEGYDTGLNSFISKVYLSTGFGIFMTAVGSALAVNVPYFSLNPFRSIGYGFLGTAIGLSSAYMLSPTTNTEQHNGVTKLYTRNTPFRIGLFTLGWLSNGVMWMPLFHMLSAMFPLVLPSFAILAVSCFGGASLAIRLLPKHYLARYSGLIGGFVGGFLGLGLLSAVKSLFGEVYYQSGIPMLDSSVGLSIFLLLLLYNTRQAVKSYKSGRADHLATSISFLYNILQGIRRALWYLIRK